MASQAGEEQPEEDLPAPAPIDQTPPQQQQTPPQQQQAPATTQQQQSRRQFPLTFNMYLDSRCGRQRRYVIGEHQPTPLYAVTTHPPSNLVLHSGPGDDSPPLAAIYQSQYGSTSTVTLPPLDVLPAPDNARIATLLKIEGGGSFSPTYTFTLETGGAGSHLEAFQWRHSSGAEVRALDDRGNGHGWKLVRLAPDAPAPRGATFASDGREVVAAWKWPSISQISNMSPFSSPPF